MLTSVTGFPSTPRITVCGGMCSSSPGIDGVVTTTSRVVGDGMVTACLVSSLGSHVVNGSTVVCPGGTVNPYSKKP